MIKNTFFVVHACKNLSCSMRVFLFAFIVYIQGRTSLEKHDFWRPLEPRKRSLRPQQSNVRRRSWPCRGHRINWINWIEQEPLLYHNYHCSSLLISSISSIYAKDMPKICQRYAKVPILIERDQTTFFRTENIHYQRSIMLN